MLQSVAQAGITEKEQTMYRIEVVAQRPQGFDVTVETVTAKQVAA